MELISAMFSTVYEIFNIDMDLFGYTISYWDVFIYGLIAVVIGSLIVRFLWN